MIKKLLLIACLTLSLSAGAFADEDQKVTSRVQKVTLFLNGAQVTRTASVNITAGTSSLVFDNISPDIDAQSIQVRGAGNFTILSVKHEMDYLNVQLRQKKVEELRAQQKELRDRVALLNASLTINQEEYNMLVKNQTVSGQNSNLDLIKLKQALDFQTSRLTENKKKEQAINNEIAVINTKLLQYDKQIADMVKGNGKSLATSNILVTVSAKAPLQSQFTLTYVVKDAGWYPTYDIRAKDVNSPVSIAYKANVRQQCGEEWKNIKLTLSTGNPTVSGSKPELRPYYLNYNMLYANSRAAITKVTGKVFASDDRQPISGVSIKVKGTSIGTQTDANGAYSLQVPAGNPVLVYSFVGFENQERTALTENMDVMLQPSANQLNEVVVAGYSAIDDNQYKKDVTSSVQSVPGALREIRIRGNSTPIEVEQVENQTNVEFAIANPYTIPADGKQYAVEIKEVNTNASYQYYSAPKLSTDVFLTAQITDWNKHNFLSGEANLFFEGTFIGKSLIDTRNTNDTLNLSLGTDKNILVTRTLQKDLTGKQVLSNNRKELRDWLITVKNRKGQPVKLLIEDQIPVSQNTGIDVEMLDTSGAEINKETGLLSYNLNLNSQDEKQLRVKYQVKYPKNQAVIVQ
ncbi:mucoidy inhibitor MuiA family protein [Mucilaginibacter litoreus]|uniref:Mucoidy inhibitor MuiA family protein n=1 Tax=Mucilaginibacter litoreus TaxID=1048221 RepID=A0ABW3AP88_9SPHI